MKKLILILLSIFICVSLYSQPSKGTITLSGDYTFSKYENVDASHVGSFRIEYFVTYNLSLGLAGSYQDYFRYGIQVNYFISIKNSDFYFSILNFISNGQENGEQKSSISITPAFNYDMSNHWTIYASLANSEAGLNSNYCIFSLNSPRIGFLFSF